MIAHLMAWCVPDAALRVRWVRPLSLVDAADIASASLATLWDELDRRDFAFDLLLRRSHQ